MTKTSLQANSATSTHLIFKKDVRNHLTLILFKKGSMTAEAALLLSLLFVVVGYLFSFLDGIFVYSKMEAALHQTAREMAHYSYSITDVIGIDMEEYADVGFGVNLVYAKKSIEKYLGKEFLDKYLSNGKNKGFDIWKYSDISEDTIDLAVSYSIPLFWGDKTVILQRCRMKKWNGFTIGGEYSHEEERVYVTENGEVYHNSRNCSHLSLSIKKINAYELSDLRNQYGEAYSACEFCGVQVGDGILYVTNEGTRFHSELGCSSLKRTVFNVPLSEVINRKSCSRCGTLQ